MRKLLIVVGLLASGVALAQDGWQHELRSVFPEPLDHWLLPWNVTAEPRNINECWPDEGDIPFLGQEYTFWCYFIPELPMKKVFQDLQTTARDFNMFERLALVDGTMGMLSAVARTGEMVTVWYRGGSEAGTLVGVATRPDRESAADSI